MSNNTVFMRWTIKENPDKAKIIHLSRALSVDKNLATLLVQRSITSFLEAKHFFRPDIANLHDPFLMKDMGKAVKRIEKAIAKNEKILVYGDYDVDGTTAVTLVSIFLQSFYPNITTYIPDRYNEGYGISFQGIDFAKQNGISLIIALDCGVKAIDKVAYANEKNIDFIICDHHRPGNKLPDAAAILDPKREDCNYPYKELCGCGVGFKLVQAIAIQKGYDITSLMPYLDLVATAIAADIVPITGENRILAYYGLQQINIQPRPGIKAIIHQLKKKKLTVTDVVFILAPRINAAGRMKHGQHAVALLSESNFEKAVKMAEEIDGFNSNRKDLDKTITREALLQIEENKETNNFTTVVYKKDWHKGVIGIVASRLTETYYRPTLVFTKSNEKLTASARSVKGFDVYNALEMCAEYIEQFGGHKYAAGLTLTEENYPFFKAKFEEIVKNSIPKELLEPELEIDLEISFLDITDKFYRILRQFAPFGPHNMNPVFLTKNVKDTGNSRKVGVDSDHLKLEVSDGNGIVYNGIGFGMGGLYDKIASKKPFDIAYNITENTWNGRTTLQLSIKDIRL